MKVLVTYYSETGNTKKIAQAIHEEASKEHDSSIKTLDDLEVSDLDNYDLVFLGSATHSSDLARPVLNFIKKIPEAPKFKLAGFVTHAVYLPSESEQITASHNRWAGNCKQTFENLKEEKGIDFLEFYSCMGAPSPPIEEFIQTSVIPNEEVYNQYIEIARKHPNEEDEKNAQEFAKRVLSKYE
jgi:flavodoxin